MPLLHCELEIKTSFGVGLQTTAGFRLILFGIPLALYFSLSYTRNFDSDREVEKVDKQRKEEKSIRERWGKAEEAEGPREEQTSLPPSPSPGRQAGPAMSASSMWPSTQQSSWTMHRLFLPSPGL